MKKALIVVDYQNDFVCGSLANVFAAAIEERICDKIKQYRESQEDIIFTFDTHNENYLHTQEGSMLPVPHCLRSSDGWQLYGETAVLLHENDRCFVKESFGSPELFDFLRTRNYQSVELVGVVSNICVMSNAILAKTALPETPIIIYASCTASNDPELHEKAMDILESMQFKVINRTAKP